MIRIVLLGRTGNHLFQYALGRVLSEKHGVPLVLDASWFDRKGWCEVSHFLTLPIHAKVTRDWHLPSRALRKLTGKHPWQYRGFPFLVEKTGDHCFDQRFLEAPADCALFGYFQSWRYFASIEDELRAHLGELLGAVGSTCSVPEGLRDPSSVAVHVRRTDFLNHKEFQVCDLRYYGNSMGGMREQLGTPKFFVFSDDPAWCRANLAAADVEVIDSGKAAENPLHDLYLMSLASHHIIANSSYSWWAAWIAKKPEQRVILPDRWFNGNIHAPMVEKDAWSR